VSPEIVPLIALIAMFVIATIFPSHIVLTVIGVTYFFGMAKQNGTIDLMVNACIRAVRGKVSLTPGSSSWWPHS